MTDRPYTDDDLRAEAARQHAVLTKDPDFMGVGEQMGHREVVPGGGVSWGDFSDDTFDAAQRRIHDLINSAANVSEWAVQLGADSLQPVEHELTWKAGEQPIVRVHFAFHDGLRAESRDYLVQAVGEALGGELFAADESPLPACVCGEPAAKGVEHRVDGPCHATA